MFYQQMKRFHIINEYGHHVRKMRNERYEIIYEHADDIDGPWLEYEFLYKPTNVNSTLPFAGWFSVFCVEFCVRNASFYLGPYLPRLDFKLYDAAPSNYRKELWTVSLAFRLLQGNRHVLALLGEQTTVTSTPTYVRATLYRFRYTTHFQSPHSYWIRLKMSEYFPAFSLANISPYLRSMKISPNYKEIEIESRTLKMILDFVRMQTGSFDGSLLIFALLLTGFVIVITKKMYRIR